MRSVCADFVRALRRPGMSKARTSRSNTAGPPIKPIGCRNWRPTWVRRRVAVITTSGGPASAFAVKAATANIPIVFIVNEDPVKLGLVTSIARPGGNLTGINIFLSELVAKQLGLLRELMPTATRVAVLVNPADATTTETTLRDVDVAASTLGLQIQVVRASTVREINAAFATLGGARPDALFVGADPFFAARRVQLANLASHHSIPAA